MAHETGDDQSSPVPYLLDSSSQRKKAMAGNSGGGTLGTAKAGHEGTAPDALREREK